MTNYNLAIALTDGDTPQHQIFYSILENQWKRSGSGDTNWWRDPSSSLSRQEIKQEIIEGLEACLSESKIKVVHYILTVRNDPSIVGFIQQLDDGAFAYYDNL